MRYPTARRCASRRRPAARWAARSARPARPASSATSTPARSSSRSLRAQHAVAAARLATSCSWAWASRSPTSTPVLGVGRAAARRPRPLGPPPHGLDRRRRARDRAASPTQALPVTLAVSLHAPDDALRDTSSCRSTTATRSPRCSTPPREYAAAKGRRVTFEYACIAGVNDRPTRPTRSAGCSRRLGAGGAHVNLIPLNPTGGFAGRRRPVPSGSRRFADASRGRAGSPRPSAATAASTSTPPAASSGPARPIRTGRPPPSRPQWPRERTPVPQPVAAADALHRGDPLLHRRRSSTSSFGWRRAASC